MLNRKVNFLNKLKASENKLLAKLLSIFGLKELESVCISLHMGSCSDMYSVKIKNMGSVQKFFSMIDILAKMHIFNSIFYMPVLPA